MRKLILSLAVLVTMVVPSLVFGQTPPTVTVDPSTNVFEWTQPLPNPDGSQDPVDFTFQCGTTIKPGIGPWVAGKTLYTTSIGSVVTAPGTYTCNVKAVNSAGSSAPSNDVSILIQQLYQLNIVKKGQGTVASVPAGIACGATCDYAFVSGTSITLTATPAAGYVFKSWTGGCTGTVNTCTVAMSAAKTVTASFLGAPVSPTGLTVK